MPSPATVSRRAALSALAALGAALSGCTASSLDRPTASPTAAGPSSHGTPTADPGRAATDPDVLLAAAVLRGEQALLDRVLATAVKHPGLRPALDGARRGHRAHVDLLTGAVPAARRPRRLPRVRHRVPAGAGDALRALAAAEGRLALRRRGHALDARSGPFARVLASMSAAASQQATTLAAAAVDRR